MVFFFKHTKKICVFIYIQMNPAPSQENRINGIKEFLEELNWKYTEKADAVCCAFKMKNATFVLKLTVFARASY